MFVDVKSKLESQGQMIKTAQVQLSNMYEELSDKTAGIQEAVEKNKKEVGRQE